MHRRIVGLCAGSALLAASALTTAGATGLTAPAGLSGAGPVPLARMVSGVSFATPPTTAQCERALHLACYAPFQFQKAYNLNPLYAKGLSGKGETIVIVDSFGYQFIRGIRPRHGARGEHPAGGDAGRGGRPSYQDGVQARVGEQRGIPDISMSAAVDGSALVYLNAKVGAGPAGFFLVGGTSEATPMLAGVVSIADQLAGHGLGLLNPALYAMESAGDPGIVDVTAGTNTVTFPQNGAEHTVRGWDAVRGYDLASGVGTINGALFVPELVAAAGGG